MKSRAFLALATSPTLSQGKRLTTKRTVAVLFSAVVLLAACGGGSGGGAGFNFAVAPATPTGGVTNTAPVLNCDDSIKSNFKPDTLTSVISVKAFAKGESLPNAPGDGVQVVSADLCLVKLLVGPGNPGPAGAPSTQPGIGIEVWLPAKAAWNGRLHAVGSGGFAGSDEANPNKISTFSTGSDFRSASTVAAQEGAVTANSDTGHGGRPQNGDFAMNPDGTINTTLWIDFSSRAIHEQVIKAKALATAYYGTKPKYTYWDGGSTGGRQGLKQAQKYPEDIDGIISGYPAINWTKFITGEVYPQIVIQRDLGGVYPSADQLNLASNAAIAACDMVGGQHLGFPLDPASCRYDPTQDKAVLCTAAGGSNTSPACLSAAQASAINKIWYGQTADGSAPDPSVDNGWANTPSGLQRWYGLSRGTNLTWLASPTIFPVSVDQVTLELQNPTLGLPSFQNATGNGAELWKDLSYEQLSNAFDRGVALQANFGDINTDEPDLSAFKARGGKLFHYHGSADFLIPPQGSINYYERVLSAMGGVAAVQSFYKLYFVPGMGHGPSNGTSNAAANLPLPAQGQIYQILTDWVEKKIEPSNIVINSAAGTPANTSLPMCAYPQKPIYKSGNPTIASSYSCS
jgi:hypothetical protein